MNRRKARKSLDEIKIEDKITDRYYQKGYSTVCDNIEMGPEIVTGYGNWYW